MATSATRCCARTRDVIAALAKRGITDLDLVLIDIWTYGEALVPERVPGPPARLVATSGCKARDGANPYANPVTGLHFVVDLNTHGAARDRGRRTRSTDRRT